MAEFMVDELYISIKMFKNPFYYAKIILYHLFHIMY